MEVHVASTHVGEDRRSWRAIALPKVMRPFNKYAVDEKKKERVRSEEEREDDLDRGPRAN